ncbi:preprotein translocase subunit SecE [bacterium CG_4_10_14_0_2_um_filter_33_32]|nr:MAG: preprotein translocase subunit SecE [bacterium CG2_30_33_46]PIR67175.1 MAG: preprotein translocase subunit SecE [bacterium CG10_big_fil_rev_8_21_14_0_10_33_18]PIU76575.1 MAG: preprotein translocase subunit SecE [bacterium CG06_land_8_20_14_3_00_33_50]PIW81255.1 MAG: preprotein translocase subunit SecE [bacterium CG_4_8_14_3_um_filter_33_28]PIY85586.1 MAG: preprotein translocase subunit SecE [bacterium CG_4_10_14_0_8_um_filter_33_57]PIZ86691.1 MAG: preprotein translocase subunit SecE [b
MKKIINYLKGAKSELEKVTWPTRKEAVRLTFVVIGLSFVFAAFIGALDLLFSSLIQRVIGQ